MDRLELFNKVARIIRPAHREYVDITDQDMHLKDSSLDSLDCLMISVFLCDVYGIDQETAKEMRFTTVRECMDFCDKHKTKDHDSVDKAIAEVNW